MANPLLKKVLGEAAEDDPVTHHLNSLGPGVPPRGRQYPAAPPPPFRRHYGHAAEERTEMQIAESMETLCRELSDHVSRTGEVILEELMGEVEQLIKMHTPKNTAEQEYRQGQRMLPLTAR